MTSDKPRQPFEPFADPGTAAGMYRAFSRPGPAAPDPEDIDLADVAEGLFSQLTPDQRERFRLIWARLCATSRR